MLHRFPDGIDFLEGEDLVSQRLRAEELERTVILGEESGFLDFRCYPQIFGSQVEIFVLLQKLHGRCGLFFCQILCFSAFERPSSVEGGSIRKQAFHAA